MYQYVLNPHVERPKRKLSLTAELQKTSLIGGLPRPSKSRQRSSHAHERSTMWMGWKTRLESLRGMSNCAFDKETEKGSRRFSSPTLGTHVSFLGTPGCTTFNHRSTGERAQLTGPHGHSSLSSGCYDPRDMRRLARPPRTSNTDKDTGHGPCNHKTETI
jgi:hypothetical protein